MKPWISSVVLPIVLMIGCDEVVISRAEVTKIAAGEAAKVAAVREATRVPEVNEKGRFQIVHAAPYFPAMVLLDTATGQTWRPCPRGDLKGSDPTAWCEMIRGEYAIPPAKGKP